MIIVYECQKQLRMHIKKYFGFVHLTTYARYAQNVNEFIIETKNEAKSPLRGL